MRRRYSVILAIAIAVVYAGCSASDDDDGSAGSGGGGLDGGQAGSAGDAGGAGGTGELCPLGMQCAAVAGSFVCVQPSTGIPPQCGGQGDCSVGECTAAGEDRYCVEPCGAEPVDKCPSRFSTSSTRYCDACFAFLPWTKLKSKAMA